jgi:Protein of unknown function (DUF3489)
MENFETLAAVKEWAADHTGPEVAAFYNALSGVKPVARFENRDIAANRIWKALAQPVIETKAVPAAEKPASPKAAKVPKTKRTPKKPKTTKKAAPSKDGRVAAVTSLVQRANGVKLSELMDRFGWQVHSARGFMSTLASKHGVAFESIRNEAGERVYKGEA